MNKCLRIKNFNICSGVSLKEGSQKNQWTIPEKIQTGGVEDMEFLGVLKKEHEEIPGV